MKKPAEPSQSDKFKAMAKEVEADGDESVFHRMLKKIVKAPKSDKRSI
jgi:hypothetical protein